MGLSAPTPILLSRCATALSMAGVSAGTTAGALFAGFFVCCLFTICARLLLRWLASRREAAAHRRRLRQIDHVFDDAAAGPSAFSAAHDDDDVELSASDLQQLQNLGAELGGELSPNPRRAAADPSSSVSVSVGAPSVNTNRRPADAGAPQTRAAALVAASKKPAGVR